MNDVEARQVLARVALWYPPDQIPYALDRQGYVSEFATTYGAVVTRYEFRQPNLKFCYFAALWPESFQSLFLLVPSVG